MKVQFTIITISYNQAQFLTQCIKSIIEQEVPVEYLIMDGGSTDNSIDIIKKLESKIAYWESGKDKGPADALNKGIEKATGDLIGFINSDDYLLPGSLRKLSEIILAHPQYDVYYGPGYINDERNGTYQKIYPSLWNVGCFRAGIAVIFQQSIFIRREFLQGKVKFNEENTTHWDAELLVDLDLHSARFYRHDESIGVFRIYPGTISDGIKGKEYWLKYLNEKSQVDRRIDQHKPHLIKSKYFWWVWMLMRDFPILLKRTKRKFDLVPKGRPSIL